MSSLIRRNQNKSELLIPTEETPFRIPTIFHNRIGQQPQKGKLNLPQIQYHNGHCNDVRDGFLTLRHDHAHTAFELCQIEETVSKLNARM